MYDLRPVLTSYLGPTEYRQQKAMNNVYKRQEAGWE